MAPQKTMNQYGYMKNSPPNRIAELRKAARMSQQEVADLVGCHWITISKLERGFMKLTTEWMQKIAAALGVQTIELLAAEPLADSIIPPDAFADSGPKFLPRSGSVISGAVAEDGDLTILPRSKWVENSEINRFFYMPNSFWAEVHGDHYVPILHPGDLIQLIPAQNTDRETLKAAMGRLSFLELKKGQGRLGYLYQGSKPGLWDLFWLGRRTLHDVRPRRMAVVMTTIHRISGWPTRLGD